MQLYFNCESGWFVFDSLKITDFRNKDDDAIRAELGEKLYKELIKGKGQFLLMSFKEYEGSEYPITMVARENGFDVVYGIDIDYNEDNDSFPSKWARLGVLK
jgi:hypothetical protein